MMNFAHNLGRSAAVIAVAAGMMAAGVVPANAATSAQVVSSAQDADTWTPLVLSATQGAKFRQEARQHVKPVGKVSIEGQPTFWQSAGGHIRLTLRITGPHAWPELSSFNVIFTSSGNVGRTEQYAYDYATGVMKRWIDGRLRDGFETATPGS